MNTIPEDIRTELVIYLKLLKNEDNYLKQKEEIQKRLIDIQEERRRQCEAIKVFATEGKPRMFILQDQLISITKGYVEIQPIEGAAL